MKLFLNLKSNIFFVQTNQCSLEVVADIRITVSFSSVMEFAKNSVRNKIRMHVLLSIESLPKTELGTWYNGDQKSRNRIRKTQCLYLYQCKTILSLQ